MTRIAFAVGRPDEPDRPRTSYATSRWAMTYGTHDVEHEPSSESWSELGDLVDELAANTRYSHSHTGPLTVYLWRSTTADEMGACTLPADAIRFDVPARTEPFPVRNSA